MKRMPLLVILLLVGAAVAQTQPPDLPEPPPPPGLINYQGTLTNTDGDPVADGTYTVAFRIYDAPTDGTLIWEERNTVQVSVGRFNVILGGGADVTPAFEGTDCYLGITVETDHQGQALTGPTEILPRQQILSAPYAIRAQSAVTAYAAYTASHPLNRVPAGTILPFAGAVDVDTPLGYIPCDGRAVSRETYADLYAAIGDAWGNGDAATTFNVPDLRGLFMRGVDGEADRDPDKESRTALNPGGNDKNNVGSLQSDEFKSHTHTTIETASSSSGDGNCIDSDPANDAHPINSLIGHTGGAETRPKNVNVNFIVRY